MEYTYFVAYSFQTEENQGIGRCDITSDKKVKSIGGIEEIEKLLKEKNKFKSLIITNIQLLNKKVEVKS